MTNNTIQVQDQIQATDTESLFPKISIASDAEIVDYLRHSSKFAEIAALAEEEALIVKLCQHFGVEVSETEWQEEGDVFRLQHKLLGVKETTDWLEQQRITLEDWSEGIKLKLLTKKLKEYLFGANVDLHYIANRDQYQQVALSQILVLDLETATTIKKSLLADPTSFCALALEHSQGKQSHAHGGFLGVLYVSQLAPEIGQAIAEGMAKPIAECTQRGIAKMPQGAIIGPVQTKLGYHLLRVEKWFPSVMSESVREEIFNTLWRLWLREQHS
ncbi:MAG: peptidylprolyl isomerase [Pleurocapsa sp. SU_5_0]|nr:peptidylprolyl isomerase [Pleurocapsa sp. SU_5_0]NJO97928.1 peptidylprolyl isomerase [Pleurocapsa sp. CRU_1_2]NJR44407.1 peptidylprolyl isomerase [Hyellaceae cyanobacterium CSU_1_1]